MPVALVLGTGLIGASIGIGLRTAGWSVAGWDPDPEALDTAMLVGALDERVLDRTAALAAADLVVLAGPPAAIEAELRSLDTKALVTDVAGVKEPMTVAAGHLRYVGGHPMAGRETSGPDGASGGLFRGATWVLTTDGANPEDVAFLVDLVGRLGAIPVTMAAADHDVAVAAISHLPQILAWALVNQVARDPAALDLAAGGFRDLTRIALSGSSWWPEVLAENHKALAGLLRRLSGDLEVWAGLIEDADLEQIGAAILSARAARGSLTAPVASVGVILEDRPGEIARVGHALEVSGVDLRDLQLRHATHGGGGVLTLAVRSAEAELLAATLRNEGFRLL